MNRLKQLRESKGMTQQELADVVGVTKGAVIHWEKYGFSSADKLDKLASCFKVSISYLLDYDTNNTFLELIAKVNNWADEHNLKKADPKIQWMRITEEVGEIRDVLLKPTKFTEPQAALKDAIGDTLVTIIVLAHQLDLDVTECLSIAYKEIKNRKGKMVNGTFVKEEDL